MNRFINCLDGVFPMSAKVMGRSLELPLRFLKFLNCAANVRMALASSIAIVVLRCR